MATEVHQTTHKVPARPARFRREGFVVPTGRMPKVDSAQHYPVRYHEAFHYYECSCEQFVTVFLWESHVRTGGMVWTCFKLDFTQGGAFFSDTRKSAQQQK
jgi:hypothetical protein